MLSARIKAWWIKKLESDSVREFVPRYNGAWLTWAVLATFELPPVSTISAAMGLPAYRVWVVLAIVANALPIIGLRMRHGGSSLQDMTVRLVKRDWWGLYFQAAGHGLACFLLVMLEISAVIGVWTYEGPNVYAGVTVLLAFMVWPWMEGTLVLCFQCLRKLDKGEQMELTGGVP